MMVEVMVVVVTLMKMIWTTSMVMMMIMVGKKKDKKRDKLCNLNKVDGHLIPAIVFPVQLNKDVKKLCVGVRRNGDGQLKLKILDCDEKLQYLCRVGIHGTTTTTPIIMMIIIRWS